MLRFRQAQPSVSPGHPIRKFSHPIRILGAALAVSLLAGCSEGTPDGETGGSVGDQVDTQIVEVRGVAAWSSPIEETVRYIGSTRAVNSVSITSQVESKVEWVGFDDGVWVEQGQPLIRLDSRRAEADLRSATARFDRTMLSEKRIESAYESGAANLTELDDIRTAVSEAQAVVDRARAVFEDHTINAPFSGRVTRRLVSLGALVQPGDAVAELNSVDPIEVEFAVPETDLPRLSEGQRVIATIVGLDGEEFRGTLATTGAAVNPVSRSAIVHAQVPNPAGRLRPGMFATVTLITGTRENAVLIPESALLTQGRRTEVFVVEDGVASRAVVELAARHRGIIEIASGVESGTTVVTSGLQALREGTQVHIETDTDLASLGIVPGAPLSEQPVTLGTEGTTPVSDSDGG